MFTMKQFEGWRLLKEREKAQKGDVFVLSEASSGDERDRDPWSTRQRLGHDPTGILQPYYRHIESGNYRWVLYRPLDGYIRPPRKLPIGSNFSKPVPLP